LVASRYTWDRIFDILFEKIILAGEHQGVHSFQAADSPLAEQENQNALVGICTPVELSFPVWPVGTAVKPAVHPAAEPVWGG
jgi:hypothetical protein